MFRRGLAAPVTTGMAGIPVTWGMTPGEAPVIGGITGIVGPPEIVKL